MTSKGKEPVSRSGVPLAVWIDDWGRWFLRTYFVGSILTLCSLTLFALMGDFPGPYEVALLLAAAGIPFVFVLVGLIQRIRALRGGTLEVVPVDPAPPPGWRGSVSQMRYLLAAVIMFGAWPGFYFVASQLAGIQEPVRFYFEVDHRLPMVTALAPVYVTIYWFFIFPALYARDPTHFWPLFRAYGTIMVICAAFFVAYPVEFPRDPLVIRNIGDWSLGIVHGVDPPINCFPSSHCAVATLSALALADVYPRVFRPALVLATGICVATVLTKQHYLVDTLAGILIGGGAYLYFFKPELRSRLWGTIQARQ